MQLFKSQTIRTSLYAQTSNIDFGDQFIGYGGFLTYFNNTIVGLDFSPSMNPFFYVKLNGSTQTLFQFGNKGQGPNDFIRPQSIQYISGQTIGVFDIMLKTYCEFSIPVETVDVTIVKKVIF